MWYKTCLHLNVQWAHSKTSAFDDRLYDLLACDFGQVYKKPLHPAISRKPKPQMFGKGVLSCKELGLNMRRTVQISGRSCPTPLNFCPWNTCSGNTEALQGEDRVSSDCYTGWGCSGDWCRVSFWQILGVTSPQIDWGLGVISHHQVVSFGWKPDIGYENVLPSMDCWNPLKTRRGSPVGRRPSVMELHL